MRAVALAWGLLGIAGIAFSAIMIVRLPPEDLGDAVRIAILLMVLIVGALSFWSALRERWPDLRKWPVPPVGIPLGWFLAVFCSVLGFAIVMAAMGAVMREPSANLGLRLGTLFAISATTLFGAWAYYRDSAAGRTVLKLLSIVAIMGCLPILLSIGVRFHAPLHGSALAVLVFSIATLWLSRRKFMA